jgi:sedoheptulose-bisphosphatase
MKLVLTVATLLGTSFAFSPSFLAKSKVSSTKMYGEYGASSTSFYTTVEKKESYESLDTVLDSKCSDPKVRQVIKDMLNVCADITEALRTALVTVEGSMNDFGDAQLSVDVSFALLVLEDRLLRL